MADERDAYTLLRQYVAQLPKLGVERIYLEPQILKDLGKPKPRPRPSGPSLEVKAAALQALQEELRDCQRCGLCRQGRTQVVFGAGNPAARLVFVGEAPGGEEDKQGIPFVGRAGQLLTKMIQAMTLTREDVYICNVIKCRPPGNRDPEPDEIGICEPFMIQQLEIIQPEVIVCLGRYAVQTLMRDSQARITRIRGKWFEYQGIPVMPTFHPSYLLRNQNAKKDVWADLQEVMARLGITVPQKS